jgi:hypothetical protein
MNRPHFITELTARIAMNLRKDFAFRGLENSLADAE